MMQKIERFRPRLTRLWFPTIVLAGCSAVFGFFVGKELDGILDQLLYPGLGVVLFLFWLLPNLAYLGTFVDFFDGQLVARRGLFGAKRVIPFADIEDISASRTKGIVVNVKLQEPLHLKGYPKPKAIATQLIALAK
jgi:hypothetical protein